MLPDVAISVFSIVNFNSTWDRLLPLLLVASFPFAAGIPGAINTSSTA